MSGKLMVDAQVWDAQNKALRDYEDDIKRLTKDNERLNNIAAENFQYAEENMERAEKAELERDRLRNLVEDAYAEGWGDNQPSEHVDPMHKMDDMWTASDSLEAINHKEV